MPRKRKDNQTPPAMPAAEVQPELPANAAPAGAFNPAALGLTPEMLQELITQYLGPTIAKMAEMAAGNNAKAILEQIPDIVQKVVRKELDQIAGRYQQQAAASPQVAKAQTQPDSGPGPSRLIEVAQLLGMLNQGGQQASSMAGLEGVVNQMKLFNTLLDMHQTPLMQGMKMMQEFYSLAARANIKPEDAAAAGEHLLRGMEGGTKQQPQTAP